MTPRNALLERIRTAARAGNRAGSIQALEPRGIVGYQGGGPDPATRFGGELTAAGGHLHDVADENAARAKVVELVQSRSARRVLLGHGAVIDRLTLPDALQAVGVQVISTGTLAADSARESFFAADVGITGVDYLVAETGTIALLAKPGEPRSVSLLPPVHIAVAERSQLIPDLFDLFTELDRRKETEGLPSSLVLITGPSKTGDIELRLVTGVHGPGEVHVVLIGG